VRRRLFFALVPFVVATIVGIVLLWPGETKDLGTPDSLRAPQYDATVSEAEVGGCEPPEQQANFVCSVVTVRVEAGPDEGLTFEFNHLAGPESRRFGAGDDVIVARATTEAGEPNYYFVDFDRRFPLLLLALIFAVVVVALSRLHGLLSLVGVIVSIGFLIVFVMPAILEGSNPLAVSIVASAAIMFLTLYLAHGVNARTTTAILGTMAALALTGALAIIFVNFGRFTGFGSEEASFLQLSAEQVNLQGLLLGGIIIGTLGVLDDVTITQASAVWELRLANPAYGVRDLYRAGIRIGRDHVASTVNTLVLAYAGASLPLLILFSVSNRGFVDVVNAEVVAEEVVRTLVGSIGLVASVPMTTFLAAAVVASSHSSEVKPKDERPRWEREWRNDDELGNN
jgi:uncharacterized membrane protein